MYDLLYVKKRRRRRIAALVSVISAIGITSLVIVSFLGRLVGTFTVSLANTSVKLALSKTKSFTESTSYLLIDELDPFEENTFRNIEAKSFDVIDNENTPYDYGKSTSNLTGETTLTFFKYTFYVKNVGSTPAEYHMRVNIEQRSWSLDGKERLLDDTLRVMIFENRPAEDGEEEKHEYKVYAKASYEANYKKDGTRTDLEFISEFNKSTNREDEDGKYKLVDDKFDGNIVATSTVPNFGKYDIMRYTIVFWLEGYDPDSLNYEEAPLGASLRLAVNITAKES
jgi:hypothetical protein